MQRSLLVYLARLACWKWGVGFDSLLVLHLHVSSCLVTRTTLHSSACTSRALFDNTTHTHEHFANSKYAHPELLVRHFALGHTFADSLNILQSGAEVFLVLFQAHHVCYFPDLLPAPAAIRVGVMVEAGAVDCQMLA